MAKDRFVDDLGRITGEELMNLLNHLDMARSHVAARRLDRALSAAHHTDAKDLAYELDLVREDAMLNIARIQVPMIEAQGIIWRAVFARRRPFRVNPE